MGRLPRFGEGRRRADAGRYAVELDRGGGRLDRMAPALSAHTEEVLASLGYDAKAIAELRAREVV